MDNNCENKCSSDEMSGLTKEEEIEFVIRNIRKYFANIEKKDQIIGLQDKIITKKNIEMLLNITFMDGIDCVYNILDMYQCPEEFSAIASNLLDWEIDFLNNMLNECSFMGIPKQFSIGLIILNLEYYYCSKMILKKQKEGIDVGEERQLRDPIFIG